MRVGEEPPVIPDPFGRAIRDHHRGEREEPLLRRDGQESWEHSIDAFCFEPVDGDSLAMLDSWLEGPLLFRFFSPDRVREATRGTGWAVREVRHGDDNPHHYRVALAKR
jgi:hypothetical protein